MNTKNMDYLRSRGLRAGSGATAGRPASSKGASARDPPSPHTALALELLGEVKDLKAVVTGSGAAYVPVLPHSSSVVAGTRPVGNSDADRQGNSRGRSAVRAGGGAVAAQPQHMPQSGQGLPRSCSRSQSRGRHASGYSPEVHAASDGLRRELGRVTDAYGALVKEYRAAKAQWAERETALVTDVGKLKGQVSTLDRLRREACETASHARASIHAHTAQEQELATLRGRVEELTKAKARAERASAEHQSAVRDLQARMQDQSTLVVQAEGSRARIAAVTHRADIAEERVRHLIDERDSLLDFTSDLQSRLSDSLRACSDMQERAVLAEQLQARVVELSAQLASAQADALEARAKAEAADGRALTLSDSAVRASTLEHVQKDLLHTVSLQAQEIQHLQAIIQDSSKDDRRMQRLEKALEAYRRVEKTFTERTGQGFFGVNGLAYELGVDVSAAKGLKQEGQGRQRDGIPASTPASAASELAEIAFCPDASEFEPALARFLSKLQDCVRGELQAQYESERQQEKAALLARSAEAEKQLIAVQQERARLVDSLRAEQAWRTRVQDLEGELSQLVLSKRHADGQSEGAESKDVAPADAADPDLSSANTLYSTDWHMLPSLVDVLPRLSSVLGRMKQDLHSAVRRRKLAEGEVQDLREELALLRGEDVAVAASQKIANFDIRQAIQAGKEERQALKSMADGLTVELSQAAGRIAELENQLARVTAEAVSLRATISAQHSEIDACRHAVVEAESERDRLRSLAALHEQRVVEGKQMNEEIFALLGQKHSEIEQQRAELRQLRARAVSLLGPDSCLQLFASASNDSGSTEHSHPAGAANAKDARCSCGCPVCGRGNQAACLPSSTYAHLRAPAYAYYDYAASSRDGRPKGDGTEARQANDRGRRSVAPHTPDAQGGSPVAKSQQQREQAPSPRERSTAPSVHREDVRSATASYGSNTPVAAEKENGAAATSPSVPSPTSPSSAAPPAPLTLAPPPSEAAPAASITGAHREDEVARLQAEARDRAEEARAAAAEVALLRAQLAAAQGAAHSSSHIYSRGSASPDMSSPPSAGGAADAQGLGGTQGSTVTIVKHSPSSPEGKSQSSPSDAQVVVHFAPTTAHSSGTGRGHAVARASRDRAFLGPDDDNTPAALQRTVQGGLSSADDVLFVSPPNTAMEATTAAPSIQPASPPTQSAARLDALQATIRSANRANTPAEGRFASRLGLAGSVGPVTEGDRQGNSKPAATPPSAGSTGNSSSGGSLPGKTHSTSTASKARAVRRGAGAVTGAPSGSDTRRPGLSDGQRSDQVSQQTARPQATAASSPKWSAAGEESSSNSALFNKVAADVSLIGARGMEQHGSPARSQYSVPSCEPQAVVLSVTSPSTAAELRAKAAIITRRLQALSLTPPSPPEQRDDAQVDRGLQRSPITAEESLWADQPLMDQPSNTGISLFDSHIRAPLPSSASRRWEASPERPVMPTVSSISVQHSAPRLDGLDAPGSADIERAKRAARASAALARRSSVADVADALGLPSGLLSQGAAPSAQGHGSVLSVTVSSKGRRASVSLNL